MNFPKHSQLTVALYVHAVIAVTLRKDFGGATLYLHPFAIAFLFFADLDAGMVVISHGLWFSWLQSLSGGHQSFVLSVVTTMVAVGGTIVVARVCLRTTKVPEKETMLVVGVVAVMMMGWQAHLIPLGFFELHVRTSGYYFLVWMMETAARKTDKMDPNSRRIMSIVLTFAVLSLPMVIAGLISFAALVFVAIHIKGITDDSEEYVLVST